jgi:mannose-6-phosphate isomerase-like protein (cupin superfamily)
MIADIRRYSPESEYFFDEGCFIIELHNSALDPNLSIAQARLEPGKTTRWHKLVNITERYQILQGKGMVEVDDLAVTEVNPGDTVIIPPGQRQRIHNHGQEDLVFLALCTPRFRPEQYQDLEP